MNRLLGRRVRWWALAVALAGLVICAIGASTDPSAFLRGWLAGWSLWIGVPLGALMLLFAHDLTGGRWGAAVRPALAAVASVLPLIALLVVPVLLGLSRLYPWAGPEGLGLENRFYLNRPFFIVRTLAFLALWTLLTWTGTRQRGSAISAPALIALALTATFAAFDWTMSLQPEWGSSIYGMQTIAADLLAGLAAAALLGCLAGDLQSARDRSDVGSLLLAGVLLWIYLSFMQFLIIWEEDLPREISWYVPRFDGAWGGVAVATVLLHLLVLLMLVWWPVKRRPAGLFAGCALLLAAYVLEAWWRVIPGASGVGIWQPVGATALIGGLAVACSGRLVPPQDIDTRGQGMPAQEVSGHD